MASKQSKLTLVIAGDNKGALKAVGGLEKGVGGLQSKFSGLGGAIGGAFSVGAVTAFGKKSIDVYTQQAGTVAQLKRLLGGSAEDASLLAFAAQQAGVPMEKVAASAGIFATNIKNGKLDTQGIATKDGNGDLLSFNQILANTADKIQALPPGFERTAAARAAFGRGGADLVKILANGADGIEELRQKMEDLGLEFDDQGLAKYQNFIHAQRDLQAAIAGVEVAFANKLVPAITKVDEGLSHLPAGAREGVTALGIAAVGATGLTLAVGALAPAWKRGIDAFRGGAAAAAETTASTEVLTGAEITQAEAAAADALAQERLAVAWRTGIGVEAASTEAAAAHTVALEAEAVATTEVATASTAGAASTGLFATGLAGVAQMAPLVAVGMGDVLKQNDKIAGSAPKLVAALHDIGKGGNDVDAVFKQLVGNKNPIEVFKLDSWKADFKALNDGLTGILASDGPEAATRAYKVLSGALTDTGVSAKDVKARFGPFLDALKEAPAAAEDAAKGVHHAAGAVAHLGAVLDATKIVDAAQAQFDLQGQAADATKAVADARTDLADATKAASTNSDEYRAAVKQEQSDLKDLADAEAEVGEREKDAADARRDVTEAVKDAVQHEKDLRQAVIDTADAQRDATTEAKRADFELRRKRDDPRSSALDIEEAQNAAIDAHHKAGEAAAEAGRAAAESANYTVNGDKAVVDAKQKVVDANKAISDAEEKVKEKRAEVAADGQAKSKILVDAAKGVKDAQDKVNEALLTQAKLNADVVASQLGPLAGNVAFRKSLQDIYDALDPNSDLATRVGSFLAAIDRAISLQNLANPAITGVGIEGTGGGHPLPRPPDPGPTKSRRNLGSGASGNIIINQIHTGTPRQVGRASSKAARRELDSMFRGGR